jgi:type IV secretory pathway VirB6-like protein
MVKSVLIFGFIIYMMFIGYEKVRGWFISRKVDKYRE